MHNDHITARRLNGVRRIQAGQARGQTSDTVGLPKEYAVHFKSGHLSEREPGFERRHIGEFVYAVAPVHKGDITDGEQQTDRLSDASAVEIVQRDV